MLLGACIAVLLVLLLFTGLIAVPGGRGLRTALSLRLGDVRVRASLPGVRSRRLELLERIALGPQHAMWLVKLDDTQVLVVTSPSQSNVMPTAELLKASAQQ